SALLVLFSSPLHAPPPPTLSTLSLHDALPICGATATPPGNAVYIRRWMIEPLPTNPNNTIVIQVLVTRHRDRGEADGGSVLRLRSEEHTSELQSPYDLVCRLLLEKKKKTEQLI